MTDSDLVLTDMRPLVLVNVSDADWRNIGLGRVSGAGAWKELEMAKADDLRKTGSVAGGVR